MVATINGMIAFYTVQSGVRRQYNEPIGAQESPRLANQNAGRWDISNTDKEKKKFRELPMKYTKSKMETRRLITLVTKNNREVRFFFLVGNCTTTRFTRL